MSDFLFIFGRTPNLSLAELQSFFPKAELVDPEIGLVRGEEWSQKSLSKFLSTLGGTVKIAEILEVAGEVTPRALAPIIEKNAPGLKINFGISSYGSAKLPVANFLKEIKSILQSSGHAVSYVAGQADQPLTSVVVTKRNLFEIIIVGEKFGFMIAKTLGVQDFKKWAERDFGRPFADPKAGMLPPKVARMAVNIALRSAQRKPFIHQEESSYTPTLLDPFCGMGTVLAEALLSGCKVIGADNLPQVVTKAIANLNWISASYFPARPADFQVLLSDATHISTQLAESSIDVIVTEPYLGQTSITDNAEKLSPEKIKNIIKGLEKLYIGCLREWYKILKSGAKLVIALPMYDIRGHNYFVKKVIDSCENLGYTLLYGPLEYSRPQAIVKREFFVFEKKV